VCIYVQVLINYLLQRISVRFQLKSYGRIEYICVLVGTITASARDFTYARQRNRSVLPLNHESVVSVKEEYTIMYIYLLHETKCV
jgi:hypothetical protein